MVPRAPASRPMPRGGLNPPRSDRASRGVLGPRRPTPASLKGSTSLDRPDCQRETDSSGRRAVPGRAGRRDRPRRYPWGPHPGRRSQLILRVVGPFGSADFPASNRPARLGVATSSLRPAASIGSPDRGKKPRRAGRNPTRRGRNREEADRPTIIAAPAAGKPPPPKSGPGPLAIRAPGQEMPKTGS
jgi:hypothetical protein